MAKTLRIRLLGSLELFLDDRPLANFPTRKSKAIFSYLALHCGRLFSRDVLASIFWEERPESSARKCLRTELWRIRSILETAGPGEHLRSGTDGIGLEAGKGVWIDVVELEKRLQPVDGPAERGLTESSRRLLQEAVGFYRGDLLEGVYDEWCLQARERLKARLIAALERLTEDHHARCEWTEAITYGKLALEHDPLHERIHRILMRSYYELGDRAMALRQYGVCAELLQKELDVEPMEETQELYRDIRASALDRREAAVARPGGDPLVEGTTEMRQLLSHLYAVVSRLEEATSCLRRTLEVARLAPASDDSSRPAKNANEFETPTLRH